MGATPCRQIFKRSSGHHGDNSNRARLFDHSARWALPRIPQGPPRLPLWGFTCALLCTPREGPLTWDAAGTISRPAAPTWAWLGLRELDAPPLPGVSPGEPPWGGPLAGTPGDYHRTGGPGTGDHIPADEGRCPTRWDSRAFRIWNATWRTQRPLARLCCSSRGVACRRCRGPWRICVART